MGREVNPNSACSAGTLRKRRAYTPPKYDEGHTMLINRRHLPVVMACIAMLGLATPVASASETIRIVHSFSGQSRVHSELAEMLPIMEAKTDYSIRFEVYAATELGVTDSLLLGQFEGIYDFVLSPANLFTPRQQNLNFLARSDLFWSADRWRKFNGSEVEAQVASLFEKDNLELMGSAWIGSENLVAREPISIPGDLEGIKIRASPISDAFVKALGATPVRTNWSEVYTALHSGVIEASVQPILWKTTDYWVKDGGTIVRNSLGGHIAWLVGTPGWRQDIDVVTADLVKSAMADSMVMLGTRIDEYEKAKLEEYAEMGLSVAEWHKEDVEVVYDAVRDALLEDLNAEERTIAEQLIEGW